MTAVAHDIERRAAASTDRTRLGWGYALVSAASFGMSGSLGKGLLEAGWSAAAAVCARILIAAAVLIVPTVRALRTRPSLLRREAPLIVAYGLIAVAGCQLVYFNAVRHLPVATALLIEFMSPIAIIAWLWVRRGHRPDRRILTGAVVAVVGLLLALDVFASGGLDVVGIGWALGAMTGAAAYYLLSERESELPPLALAGGGLLVGGVALALCGVLGILPFHATTHAVQFAHRSVSWWIPLLGLGVVTAAIAYVSGIAATRLLGSRLASFAALGEVLCSMGYAAWLLGERPEPVQLVGAALVLAGVVLVKLGEDATA